MRGEWRFYSAGEIIFGRGAVRRTGSVARRLGSQRVLLVTDPGLMAAGQHRSVVQSLADARIEVVTFDGGVAKPTLHDVAGLVSEAQHGEYDALVALGGGSNIDLAKAAAVVLRYGGTAEDFFGVDQVPGPIMSLIAVSTTAGTGSEVSGASVLADPDHQRRGSILSNRIRPSAAIYDPLLTQSCPRQVTADAGIDALSHAVEAYMVVDYANEGGGYDPESVYQGRSPLSDLLAERSIELVGRYLRRAVFQPSDLEAREGMHLASLLAGLSFSNAGLTAVHALEYPVGVATGCTHGAGNGLFLPFVMEYNIAACPERLAKVAELLGETVECCSKWQAAEQAVHAVHTLRWDIGIPASLKELGVEESQLRPLAESTAEISRLLQANPRPLDVDDLEGILRRAW